MKPIELRAFMIDNELTGKGLAKLCALAELGEGRTVRKWLGGDRDIPGPVVQLIRLLDSMPRATRAKSISFLTAPEN